MAAAKGFCEEFSNQHKVKVVFTHIDIPPDIPAEISVCLFRILQEGLQNAAKHSGVALFDVRLRGTSGNIELNIRDRGAGFNPADASQKLGLGLISMRERASLVGGAFSISSKPGGGTEINVSVPIPAGFHPADSPPS